MSRRSDIPLSLAAAYPERAELQPRWHDRLADAVFDHLWWPVVHRLRRPTTALRGIVPLVEAHAVALRTVEGDFSAEVARVRAVLRRQGLSADAVAQALALLRVIAEQTLGKRPYDVQLMGAWALLQGRLAEMATGEGKSLTAALAVAAAALSGLPVHLVTVNDYLAGRDAEPTTA